MTEKRSSVKIRRRRRRDKEADEERGFFMVEREIEGSKVDRRDGLERNDEKGKEDGIELEKRVLMPSKRHMNEYNFAKEQRGPLLSKWHCLSHQISHEYMYVKIIL